MKKLFSLIACLILEGCLPSAKVIHGPSPGVNYPYQDSAPLPWVCVLPSERAMAMKDVDFKLINHQVRFDMSFEDHTGLYKNIDLVLIDYTILPPGSFGIRTKKIVDFEGTTYSQKYQTPPKHYFMHVSFFECGKHPPATPAFEETNMLPADYAPPQEAMQVLMHNILRDHAVSRLKKINARF